MRPLLLMAVLTALTAGCGENPEARPATERSKPARADQALREPYELTCRDLRAPAAQRQAVEFVADVVVAPVGQSRRETLGMIRRSLQKTCALTRLPNVEDPADYRPVRPVRQAVQNHFDQDAIYDN